ncbi:peptidoglycan-binding protein [Sphingomonas parapaucimobilis]|uniref:peptidoglycan-binding protein n=1 Tax=Sphingomonas parapaucimobilis TaxID=28213 RepID=UPI00321A6346
MRLIQSLLSQGGWHPGLIDGFWGRHTLSAILAFQRRFMHHPDGLVEPDRRTWRLLNDPHQRQTGYRSLGHRSVGPLRSSLPNRNERAKTQSLLNASSAPAAIHSVPKARAIQLTAKDVKDLKKTLQTEWFAASGPEQAYGIIDTILNRLASGHWGNTITDVVNARKQFSDINGPPAWSGKDGLDIGPHNRVEQIPDRVVRSRTDKLTDAYLIERARGRASIFGTHLDYANPNPHYSSPNNIAWIKKLQGPSFGKGNAVHRHGTTADKERFRPKPYYILLPATRG